MSAGAGAALKAEAERQACAELGYRAGCVEQAGALERRRGIGVGQQRAGPRPSKRERGGKSGWAAKQRVKPGRGREKRARPNLELG